MQKSQDRGYTNEPITTVMNGDLQRNIENKKDEITKGKTPDLPINRCMKQRQTWKLDRACLAFSLRSIHPLQFLSPFLN